MNCKKCGYPLSAEDQFCKNCGTAVNLQGGINSNQGVNTQTQPIGQSINEIPVQNNITQSNPINMEQPVNTQMNTQTQQMGQAYSNTQDNIQQPINNQQMNYSNTQSSWSNSYNSVDYNQQKPNNKKKLIIIGAIVLVVVILVVVLILVFTNKDNDGGAIGNVSTYTVNYSDFELSIPDNLLFEYSDGSLLLADQEETWVARMDIIEGTYSQLQSNVNRIQATLQQQGLNSTNIKEQNLGGVDYITMELSYQGQNEIAGFTSINSMYIAVIEAYSVDNDFNFDILEQIAPVISSAKYNAGTNNISINSTLDLDAIGQLAK